MTARPAGEHPIDTIRWMPAADLRANDWSPNNNLQLDLLTKSILTDGWTQPIVIDPSGRIIDGEHRHKVAVERLGVAPDGLVPVVVLDIDRPGAMASTIRHNRATGAHALEEMLPLVAELESSGADTCDAIGLTPAERRLFQVELPARLQAGDAYTAAWEPDPPPAGPAAGETDRTDRAAE